MEVTFAPGCAPLSAFAVNTLVKANARFVCEPTTDRFQPVLSVDGECVRMPGRAAGVGTVPDATG